MKKITLLLLLVALATASWAGPPAVPPAIPAGGGGTIPGNLVVTGTLATGGTGTEFTVDASGNIVAATVDSTGAVSAGTLTINSGSITDSSGAISFSNENLTTTGTLAAGATTVSGLAAGVAATTAGNVTLHDAGAITLHDDGNNTNVIVGPVADGTTTLGVTGGLDVSGNVDAGTMTVASGSITDSSGAISFGDENLTTTGTLAGATLNTGQGAYELYGMDQNVLTSSSPSFAAVSTDASSQPGISFDDSDAVGASTVHGKMYFNLDNTGNGTEISDWVIQYITAGSLATSVAWDGSDKSFYLPQENDAATPSLSFGDRDTGLYESADDTLHVSVAGTSRANITATALTLAVDLAQTTGKSIVSNVDVACADADDTCAYNAAMIQHWVTSGADATGDTMTVAAGTDGQTITVTVVAGTDDVVVDVSTGTDKTLADVGDSVTYRYNGTDSTWWVIGSNGI